MIEIQIDEVLMTALERVPDVAGDPTQTPADNVISIDLQEDKTLVNAVTRLKLKRLAMRGVTAKDAAAVVGWHPVYVRGIYRDPAFRHEVLSATESAFEGIDADFEQKQKTFCEIVEEQAYDSFLKLQELASHPNVGVSNKIKIHQDFLDRAEITSAKKTQIHKRSNEEVLDRPSTLQVAAQAAREMDEARQRRLKIVGQVGGV